jgi:hypothetical protein
MKTCTIQLALLALLFAGCSDSVQNNQPPDLCAPELVQSVLVTIDPNANCARPDPNKKPIESDVTDISRVLPLLELLSRAKPATDHKCGDNGSILIRKRDGNAIRIGLLEGHDARSYEYRLYHDSGPKSYTVYSVDKTMLFKAFGLLGLSGIE